MNKKLLDEQGIPVPAYKRSEKCTEEDLYHLVFSCSKAKLGGYDGQGVQVLKVKKMLKQKQ